jgi:hypothetical protein
MSSSTSQKSNCSARPSRRCACACDSEVRRLPGQRVHVEAVRPARDADRHAAVVAHQRQQVAVAGIFHQHDVAGAGEGPQYQVEGVGGAVGQQDLLGFEREQLVGQGAGQVLAQRRKTERMAVAA